MPTLHLTHLHIHVQAGTAACVCAFWDLCPGVAPFGDCRHTVMEEQRGGMSALGVETQRRGAGLCGFVGPVKEAGFLQKQIKRDQA